MRAPWEHPAAFAFESALDEVAYAVGQDPVELRLANDTATDPVTGKPFLLATSPSVSAPAPNASDGVSVPRGPGR